MNHASTHAKLIAWINTHDIGCGSDNVIDAELSYLIVMGTAVEPGGELVTTIDRIPATWTAASQWLGY